MCSVFDWIITSSSLLTNCRVSSLQHAVCGQMCVVTIVVLSSKYYYTALSLLCWKEKKIFFRCSRFTHSTFLCSNTLLYMDVVVHTASEKRLGSRFISMNHPTHLRHTSKINVLRSSLNSEEMLQNFLYLYKKKTQVVFFVFHFEQLSFFPLWMPWSMST